MEESRSIEIDSAMRFEGHIHITNHINYLFRTDKGQKWTSEHTTRCIEFRPGNKPWRFPASFDERCAHKLELHRDIARNVGAANVNAIKASGFEMTRADLTNEEDAAWAANGLLQIAEGQSRWVIDLIVLHADQDDLPHLHVLGHLKPGLKRKNGENLLWAFGLT